MSFFLNGKYIIYIIKIMLMYKSRVLGVLKNNKKEENKRTPKNQDNTTLAKII
jgi:hypothetical protein